MKIVEYKCVFGDGEMELSQEVNKSIKDGWQPFGSPTAVTLKIWDYDTIYQAMVKYE